MSPMPPEPLNSLRLPSRSPKSNTLDTRPPNRAGMLPLYTSTLLMASALNTLKNPNK